MFKRMSCVLAFSVLFCNFVFAMSADEFYNPYAHYESEKKTTIDAFGCSMLAFLTGFGIGQFVQGDNNVGLACLIVDALGIAGIAYSAIDNEDNFVHRPLFLIGLSTVVISRMYQTIRPYIYKNVYNKKLYKSIFGDNVMFSMDVSPIIDDNLKIEGVSLVGRISF